MPPIDPPTTTCSTHGLVETAFVYLAGGKREPDEERECCPLCVPDHSYGRIEAVWDGSMWSSADVWSSWRQDWCRQTGHDNGPALQRWDQAREALRDRSGHMHLVWILLMSSPTLEPERAVVLTNACLRIVDDEQRWELLRTGDVARVTEIVDASWSRLERYLELLWSLLDDRMRGRVVALATRAGPELDLRLAPTDMADLFQTADERARAETDLTWRDLHAWRDEGVFASSASYGRPETVEALLALRSRVRRASIAGSPAVEFEAGRDRPLP